MDSSFSSKRKFRSHQENTTTASSLSLASSWPENWKHHVFPSFHGPDVRRSFLSHILKEFGNRGIDTFIDNDIVRSMSIGHELIEAIRGSRIAMVFLSKNYASSTWCLDELVEIIKCREELSQTVMALFYEVDPTDVKKQRGDFGKVFRKTCKGKTKDDIERWKQALEEVANIAGYHSKNWDNEARMIEKISSDVSNKLNNSTPSSDNDGLVGMESHMITMGPLLRLDSEEVRIIGILGPPGIGKTTIARFLYNQYSQDFQLSVFMENIKASYPIPACSNDYSVKKYLQEQFMSQLINEEGFKIPHLGIAKDRLKDKRVFAVLDDVDKLVQVEAMAKDTCWFGPYSRIIITTQNQKLLKASGINLIYKVDFPSSDEALEMFSMYAFGQKSPKDGFMELARKVTGFVGELPLGLRVMGSYFRGMSKQEWEKALPRLMTSLDGEIESILRFSYDALGDEDKKLFLHIACFFNNESVDKLESYLANSFFDVKQGLRTLAEKSLISLGLKTVEMHSLLVQLGREIVRKQNVTEPEKRMFLVDTRDITEVLSDDKADSSSVIGIDFRIDFRIFDHNKEDVTCISERAFERFSNLQFLRIHSGPKYFLQSLNSISQKLILLSWIHFPMASFPSNISLKFLVKLDMPSSELEKLWEGIQPLNNLKWMNLSFSYNLKELPDLSTATNLCELNLAYCSRLVTLHSSIGSATNLQILDINHCSCLVDLPSSIGNAINLEKLDISHCTRLMDLPSSIGNAIKLKQIKLKNCSSMVKLPISIGDALNLESLDLNYCSSLVRLPFSIGNAIKLKYLYLNYCSSLVELPSSIGNAINLERLDLNSCPSLVELPSSIGNAINLQILKLSNCSSLVKLPSSIGNAINLQILKLNNCSSLVELPSSMKYLRRLSRLDLTHCSKLEVLLTNINLESLKELDLSGCSSLKSYNGTSTNIEGLKRGGNVILEPTSSMSRLWPPPSELEMPYCKIQELGPWIGRVCRLRRLVLRGMQNLVSLPQLPYSLLELDANNCKSLEKLDCSFRNPDIRLNFLNCFKLNQEARDLIIQTPTNRFAVLPGGEVPVCFTNRASGSFVTMKLNQKPLRTSTKFRACIILGNKDNINKHGVWAEVKVYCSITSERNALTACSKPLIVVYPDHLYTFEVEVEEVTSTEVGFDFHLCDHSISNQKPLEIKECGILQLLEDPSC